MENLAKQLERILFKKIHLGDKRAMNKWADIDHLVGHVCAHRDVFVTWDKKSIWNKRKELREQLEITVETPEELISRFNEQ